MWSEEALEEKRDRRISVLDGKIERAEKRLEKLNDKRDQLISQQFDVWYARERNRLD